MIRVEHLEIWGLKHAIRGMRNPMNSWNKSDSHFEHGECEIGENDLRLMEKLVRNGSSHRKFLRQIFVSVDIIAPLYWWREFDTYKVGTTANSCSTMHKIHAKEFSIDDFSTEHLIDDTDLVIADGIGETIVNPDGDIVDMNGKDLVELTIRLLNAYRERFIETGDKKYWWQLIQLLPDSYNQKRTVTMNYENLHNMCKQRRNHKLDEWRFFCEWAMSLPYTFIN